MIQEVNQTSFKPPWPLSDSATEPLHHSPLPTSPANQPCRVPNCRCARLHFASTTLPRASCHQRSHQICSSLRVPGRVRRALRAETSLVPLVRGCNGSKVSVGAQKLCHNFVPVESLMTRLPVSRRTAVVPLPELVLLSQFAVPLTSARTRPYDGPILAVGEPDGEGESIPSNFIEATREIGVWPSDHGMEEELPHYFSIPTFCLAWTIWKERNNRVFNQKSRTWAEIARAMTGEADLWRLARAAIPAMATPMSGGRSPHSLGD
uniref:Uncharacterized protein n=1 Tax=Oryza barthii TaxID=65489 RepID=A0A0D3ESA4_9ORYZ